MPPVVIARGGLRVSKDTSFSRCTRVACSRSFMGFASVGRRGGLVDFGTRDLAAPVRLLRQEAVDHLHVQFVAAGTDAQPFTGAGGIHAHVQRLTSAHSVLLMPNSLMKPSASSTPQSADCA